MKMFSLRLPFQSETHQDTTSVVDDVQSCLPCHLAGLRVFRTWLHPDVLDASCYRLTNDLGVTAGGVTIDTA